MLPTKGCLICLLVRIKARTEEIFEDYRNNFRQNKLKTHQIFRLRQIVEKSREFNSSMKSYLWI